MKQGTIYLTSGKEITLDEMDFRILTNTIKEGVNAQAFTNEHGEIHTIIFVNNIEFMKLTEVKQKKTPLPKVKESKESALVYAFDTESFKQSWNLWLNYRKEIKKSIKGITSMQGQMNKIAKLSEGNEELAKAIIMQSIENNWTGLFNLKTENNEQRNTINNQSKSDANRSAVERLTAKYQNGF